MTLSDEIKNFKEAIEKEDIKNITLFAQNYIENIKNEELFDPKGQRSTTLIAEAMVDVGTDLLPQEIVKQFVYENLGDDSLLKLILSFSRLETEEFKSHRESFPSKVSSTALSFYILNKILISGGNVSQKTVEIIYDCLVPKVSSDLYRFIIEDYFSMFGQMSSLNHVDFIVNSIYNLKSPYEKTLLNMKTLSLESLRKDLEMYLKNKIISINSFTMLSFPAIPVYLIEIEIIKFANNFLLNSDNLKLLTNELFKANSIYKKNYS